MDCENKEIKKADGPSNPSNNDSSKKNFSESTSGKPNSNQQSSHFQVSSTSKPSFIAKAPFANEELKRRNWLLNNSLKSEKIMKKPPSKPSEKAVNSTTDNANQSNISESTSDFIPLDSQPEEMKRYFEHESENPNTSNEKTDSSTVTLDNIHEDQNEASSTQSASTDKRINPHIAIIPKDYPATILTNSELKLLRTALLQLVVEQKSNPFKPQFIGSKQRDGWFSLTCKDSLVSGWVMENFHKVKLWDGANLQVINANEVPKVFVLIGKFPHSADLSDSRILDFLEAQNSGLLTDLWKVIKRIQESYTATLIFQIDCISMKTLRETEFSVFYKFGQIKLDPFSYYGADEKVTNFSNTKKSNNNFKSTDNSNRNNYGRGFKRTAVNHTMLPPTTNLDHECPPPPLINVPQQNSPFRSMERQGSGPFNSTTRNKPTFVKNPTIPFADGSRLPTSPNVNDGYSENEMESKRRRLENNEYML